jgi:hypothetical protein
MLNRCPQVGYDRDLKDLRDSRDKKMSILNFEFSEPRPFLAEYLIPENQDGISLHRFPHAV